jgi:hypothetical protein
MLLTALQVRRLLALVLAQNHPTPMARLQPHRERQRQEGHVQRRHLSRPLRQSSSRRQDPRKLEAMDP